MRHNRRTDMAEKPLIVAHRGLHKDVPENSIESFVAAFAAGVNAVETDVRLTADGVAVLLHDDTLDRMTTAKGHLAAAKFAELQTHRLKHNDKPTEFRLPQLGELYTAINNPTAKVAPDAAIYVVELKINDSTLTKHVVESRRAVRGRVIVQSFIAPVVEEVMAIDPECDAAILCGNADELAAALKSKCKRLNVSHRLLTRSLVQQLRGEGRAVGVWTVNTEVEIRGSLAVGTDMIITDEPLLARRIVDENG